MELSLQWVNDKIQKEGMIHLLYPNSDKLLKQQWVDYWKAVQIEKGNALKEVDVEDADLQLKNDQFKTVQGGMYFLLRGSTFTTKA